MFTSDLTQSKATVYVRVYDELRKERKVASGEKNSLETVWQHASLEACLETKRGFLGLLFEITLFNLTIKGVKYKVIPFLAELFRIIGSYTCTLYIHNGNNRLLDASVKSSRRHVMQSKGKFERPYEKSYCVRIMTKEG
ncbi:hypothetical protein K0M31_015835 [Melipona bicolor]|uniref:Uncharacterized protein n=1 Tax=Melipona bicolor TaxID=60889 RepID=A0AA40KER3_9HYME|nr:hypothetical protein K0M31_015835 [Melipona bicolor]